MTRVLIAAAFVITAAAQTPSAGPAFEVAVIRPGKPLAQAADGSFKLGLDIGPDSVKMRLADLELLIRTAYNIKGYQLEGPDWLVDSDIPTFYDIEAKLPAGSTADQVPVMLQNLLRDRFKLAIRKGSKVVDTYALIAGKSGPTFKRKNPADQAGPVATSPSAVSATEGKNGEVTVVRNGTKITMTPGRGMKVETSTISGIVDYLATRLQKPVIDKTGLTGDFDIKLEVLPSGPLPGQPSDLKELMAFLEEHADLVNEPMFAAVEKLGLKVERQKNPVETIIVEHVEKTPTEN